MIVKTRFRAFAIHVCASIVVFSAAIAVLLTICYPPPYYRLEGLWDGLKIAAAVDLVAGPLTTLCIYRLGKKGLKFDLYCIALVQLIALSYGMVTIYQQRPYFVVYGDDAFETVRWRDVKGLGVDDATLEALHAQAPGRPPIIAVRPPSSVDEKAGMAVAVMTGEVGDFSLFVKRYTPITPEVWKLIKDDALKPQSYTGDLAHALDALCASHHCTPDALKVFRLRGRTDEQYIAFDAANGQLVGYPDTEAVAINKTPAVKKVKR